MEKDDGVVVSSDGGGDSLILNYAAKSQKHQRNDRCRVVVESMKKGDYKAASTNVATKVGIKKLKG
jgi:PP-loop superfamily ATP-utilizing enzyme